METDARGLSQDRLAGYMASAYNAGDDAIDYAVENHEVVNQNYVDQFDTYYGKADKLYCGTGQFACSAG